MQISIILSRFGALHGSSRAARGLTVTKLNVRNVVVLHCSGGGCWGMAGYWTKVH
jgi:hypothetical protein